MKGPLKAKDPDVHLRIPAANPRSTQAAGGVSAHDAASQSNPRRRPGSPSVEANAKSISLR